MKLIKYCILFQFNSSAAAITVEENIEPEKVGIIIGSKGSTIMEIMKKSGAKVVINQEFPKGQPHRIIYTGKLLPLELRIKLE